jgi:cob(I)alamin adenosyltransferase
VFKEEKYDIFIMDEVLISVRDGFLEEEELLEILDLKPEHMELVLTGRGATDAVIEKAHLVSSIENIKHPYDQGIDARKGIEF